MTYFNNFHLSNTLNGTKIHKCLANMQFDWAMYVYLIYARTISKVQNRTAILLALVNVIKVNLIYGNGKSALSVICRSCMRQTNHISNFCLHQRCIKTALFTAWHCYDQRPRTYPETDAEAVISWLGLETFVGNDWTYNDGAAESGYSMLSL